MSGVRWTGRGLGRVGVILVLASVGAGPAAAQTALPQFEVKEVAFTGNDAVSDRVLERSILTRATECVSLALVPFCWFGLDFARDVAVFSPRAYSDDLYRVILRYRGEGFREVQVDTATTIDGDGRIRAEFLIEEGRPTLVGSLEFRGGDDPGLEGLLDELPIREGDRLSGTALEQTRELLLGRLRDAGYARGEVLRDQFIPNDDPFSAEVGFDIYPEARFRFGSIVIDESETLEEPVIRGLIPFETGDPFSPQSVFDAQRAIYSLDIVSYASVDTVPDPVEDTLMGIRVRVTEGDLRRVRAGGGWSTAECFNSEASWTNRNFYGGARRLEVRGRLANIGAEALTNSICPQAGTGEYGELNWLVSTEFTQPRFLSSRQSLTASLFSERQSLQDVFVRQAVGVSLGVSRRVGRFGTLTLSYQPQLSRTEAAEIFFCTSALVCDPAEADILQGFNWLAPVEVAYSQDRRDQVLNPRRGYFWVLSAGHASAVTGSDYAYERMAAEVAGYHATEGAVFAARLRGGWLYERGFRGLGSEGGVRDVVPPEVRLFAGGANSVRGFPQNRLGPRVLTVPVEALVGDLGDGTAVCTPQMIVTRVCDGGAIDDRGFDVRPTGGSLLLEGSVETRFGLGRPELEGAVFVDWGQVWDEPGEASLGEFEFAPGIGVRYLTPIGPIRIDLGYSFRGEEALKVVTSEVRPFNPATDDPGDRLTGPTGSPLEWVRTDELALLDPRVAFGERDLWSIGRLQLHFSIGQAY